MSQIGSLRCRAGVVRGAVLILLVGSKTFDVATCFTFGSHPITFGRLPAPLFSPCCTFRASRTMWREHGVYTSSSTSYRVDTSLSEDKSGSVGGSIDGGVGDSSGSSLDGGMTLSTKQILNPELYLGESPLFTPPDDTVPLSSGLRLILKSLESIVAEDPSISHESMLDHLDAITILRIEQSISAVRSMDPLCWIHAQRRSVDFLRRTLRINYFGSTSNSNAENTLPVVYFSDAEGRMEAAALGKASPAYSNSWDPFAGERISDDIINGRAVNGATPCMFKQAELPPGARVYGGSRFDWQNYEEKRRSDLTGQEKARDDWDGFGGDRGGYWFLPAVELRTENIESVDNETREIADDQRRNGAGMRTATLAIHLHNLSPPFFTNHSQDQHRQRHQGWRNAARHVMSILRELTDELSPAVPCTTLPPVLTRSESIGKGDSDADAGLTFERGVTEALRRIQLCDNSVLVRTSSGQNNGTSLRKVVLARKTDLNLGSLVSGLDVLMRVKFGGHVGHLFYLNPGDDGRSDTSMEGDQIKSREFLGCAPERLFRVDGRGYDKTVRSEAIAGTRIRGHTPSADAELLHELLSSKKDMLENEITGQFIKDALLELEENGRLEKSEDNLLKSYDFKGNSSEEGGVCSHQQRYFVRRLRHLQHICQTFERKLSKTANVIDVSRSLLKRLHPTPAVCGDSPATALEFIRQYEAISFDRGYYAGPFGYIGHDCADVVVALRSALVTNYHGGSHNAGHSSPPQVEPSSQGNGMDNNLPESKVSVFGGAGIVDGSTAQEEWIETSHKMGVMSSLFPPSPVTLQSYSTPNVAWSTAFIEEVVRCGVTQFYICPGSRNTPLTCAIFKSMRSNVNVVRAISVHDERGAGFRALGYARRNGRPAAVVTSSGTAVANLYPSIVESSSDGVPLLILTADRPYENRDTGSNQSIDQVKIFSPSYVRWFRDIAPPSDDVPVSLALSDANHAVTMTKQLMGPVHLNVQFRENLAPEGGPIRNDHRIGSTTKFHNLKFTDVPGFSRWSWGGNRWQDAFYSHKCADHSVLEVADLIRGSRRGIIVTGNLRGPQVDGAGTDLMSGTIAHFAQVIGFPILASVQSGALRQEHPAIPYAEHLLKNPRVSNGMRPDLILQLGSPLISTEISQVIKGNPSVKHVLVQKFYPHERADPDHTITHRISSDVGPFLNSMMNHLDQVRSAGTSYGSELAPLLYLGRELQKEFSSIIHESSLLAPASRDTTTSPAAYEETNSDDDIRLTEPQVIMAISEVLSELSAGLSPTSLFLSNSMPVRDGEFFLYPPKQKSMGFPSSTFVNRGASGIDGIISTAIGCGDTSKPITLVCGDVTALHDLNALYGLTQDDMLSDDVQPCSMSNRPPLTTVIVNNGGGAIFSFLPISKHGQEVGFEEFWGTPTLNLDYGKCVSAFGLPYARATSFKAFKDAYRSSIQHEGPAVIEAKVVGRSTNVGVHHEIIRRAKGVVDAVLSPPPARDHLLPIKRHTNEDSISRAASTKTKAKTKTLLLLHGWMGDKSEWDAVGRTLTRDLSEEWDIISIDLPGHGETTLVLSSDQQVAHSSLGLDALQPFGSANNSPFSLDMIARTVCRSLLQDHGVEHLDAIAGYSLGGRIALAMKRLSSTSASSLRSHADNPLESSLVTDQTSMILLGSSPGNLPSDTNHCSNDDVQRLSKDFSLAESLFSSAYRSYVTQDSQDKENLTEFLTKWYSVKSLWGDLRQRHPLKYESMLKKRLKSLIYRRQDIASVLCGCSPPLTLQDDWKAVVPSKALFVAGGLDKKYSCIGRTWEEMRGIAKYVEIANVGHALLVEEPRKVSSIISSFVKDEAIHGDKNAKDTTHTTVKPPTALKTSSTLTTKKNDVIPSRLHQVGILEYEAFSITIGSNNGSKRGVQGIGWGERARLGNKQKTREGFIVSIASKDGMAVGVGEVSPLTGLHKESVEESEHQLQLLKEFLTFNAEEGPEFDAAQVLSLNGSLTKCIDILFGLAGINKMSAASSVRAGLEMALLSLSSQLVGTLLPQALAINHWLRPRSMTKLSFGQLPINGLVTRGETNESVPGENAERSERISFPSVKVKVGHNDSTGDALNLIRLKESSMNTQSQRLRVDANRAWDIVEVNSFISELKRGDSSVLEAIEFIEEPLEPETVNGKWSFDAQVAALESFANGGGLSYALDESVADLAIVHDNDFENIALDLQKAFGGELAGHTGCAAFVLKPALIGLELSMQLAKLAQQEFQISPVFSSSFDSGIGLAYTAILAAVADSSPHSTNLTRFSHGLGTFNMLDGDTLSPPFKSYVNMDGLLNVPSLSRALYGLSLDEITDRLPTYESVSTTKSAITTTETDSYLATTSSTTGRDITVSVSLLLPFSDGIASTRFMDLPQMPRWSPWLNSVTYLNESPGLTEWSLNIRGVKFCWKAKSEILTSPKGIKWESISGLKNRGVVEFEPLSHDSCTLKAKMSILMPHIVVTLFQGTPLVARKFLQNKLLKWSLEMFRDVVKADLALERGDQELGDALFGAVEGRANALEEALK